MLNILSRGMDYIAKEWQVIRQAPLLFGVALATLSMLFGIGAFTVLNWHYSGAVSFWQGAISVRDGTIQQLEQQLAGVSPQVAAMQAGRDVIRKKLEDFYIQGGRIFNTPPLKDEDIQQYIDAVHKWELDMDDWVKPNMGIAAEAKLFDRGFGSPLSWDGYPPAQSNWMNYIQNIRRNISILIETAAWDGSTPKVQAEDR